MFCEVCRKQLAEVQLYHIAGQRWACRDHVKLVLRDVRAREAKQAARPTIPLRTRA